ncbi:uncharacterized protein CC84DRAFT_37101 [Paraphaeosphaeria sporulosa]|uniref:Uncharacterized protein n=1 Tax=Paraphaeosphaeria sporulosa TaxID=1460663 RepID=A0A177CX54_9PLEO|nr:uncharacterized protein CC84DRAFT_37101 [Paraphaeosphaeria sporulosa]OAG11440.1 hypothetical protein CC84DRAFT_37101 [Paraphaeosphaeria sporulosa]
MRIYVFVLAYFLLLSQATIQQPIWIMSGSRNSTRAPQLSHPMAQRPLADDYVHVTPSIQSRTTPSEPYLPFPGFWTCPRNTALPPNTEDCLQVIMDTFRQFGNMTVDMPADRCIQIPYRSCVMYTCSSSCEGFQWSFAEWSQLAMHIQRSCIWGRGGGGYVQRQPGGEDKKFVYRTGLTHVDEGDSLLAPALVC